MPEQVELRTDNRITSRDDATATPEDAQQLHKWPSTAPTAEDPVTVAVMDSGIHANAAENHPWFENATVAKRHDAVGDNPGADEVGHGTGVASIVARNTPRAELYDVRIFGKGGRTGFDAIRNAYKWLIDHADEIDIVNMSWGARKDVPQINALHEKLVNKGVHDVVAAGNTGDEGGSPSTSKVAFSVGAVDASGDLTRFTSRDPKQDNPDVAAVGKNVKMARAPGTSTGSALNDQFVKGSGTSFSCPYTTAAYVNALYERRQSWDRNFERAAPDIPGTKADGEGLLKLQPALDGTAPEEPEKNPTADASVWSFLGGDTMFLSADWLPNGDTVVEKVEETKDAVTVKVRK